MKVRMKSTPMPFFNFNISFPLLTRSPDSLLECIKVNELSLLYQWQGSNSSLDPLVLMGHYDVVPVPEENKADWTHAPFEGTVKDDYVWGRGTMDDKISIIGIMEATELLLSQHFQPERTIYFSFGHDEEMGGEMGTKKIVDYMKKQGIAPAMVLDEGYAVTQKMVPGVEQDVAIIGIAEKGDISLELSINIEGGHSSMPKKETALDVMASGISKLKSNPFDAKISTPLKAFMKYLGPEMAFTNKMAFANPGIFKSMIINTYSAKASGNAMVRTTTAPTVFNSGVMDNVVPKEAKAIVNFRILPGEDEASVIAHVKEVLNDNRFQITTTEYHAPSPTSSFSSSEYEILNRTIKEVYPEALTTPNLVVARTDAWFYHDICNNVYRFLPIHLNDENVSCIHGVNERISTNDVQNAVRFYIRLIENMGN